MSDLSENKSWTPQDIVNNASNWSLAADKELLKHLETLSERILTRASKTNENLVQLLDDLDDTGLTLDVVTNNLESLHHTQFIESRVYDDEDEFETPINKETESDVGKAAEEEKARREIKEGIQAGVEALQEFYECMEVPNSDSEDETESPNYVWKPKDPYLTRPLPLVIGTTEWYKKWHVGLLDDSSDDEDGNTAAVKRDVRIDDSSSSDEDRYLPTLDRRGTLAAKGSEWKPSDVIDIDSRRGLVGPIANSTIAAGSTDFGENNDISNSIPIQEPSDTFAEQLAKKLGNVVQSQEVFSTPEVNKRPIQKAPANTIDINLFFDEPPPLTADDDSSDNDDMFGKPGKGLFPSSGAGLFDDLNENEPFSSRNTNTQPKSVAKPAAVVKTSKKPQIEPPSNIFENESEDDLFGTKPADTSASRYLPKTNTALPLFNEEPPDLPILEEKKKKPVGGVSIFGNADIMTAVKPGSLIKNLRRPSTSDSRESEADLDVASSINKTDERGQVDFRKNTSENVNKTEVKPSVAKKDVVDNPQEIKSVVKPKGKVNLFDEGDSLFEDDLFSNISTKKFTSSLFDDVTLEDNDSSSLFYSSNVTTVKSKHKTPNILQDGVKSDDNKQLDSQKGHLFTQNNDSSIPDVKSDIFSAEPRKRLNLFDDNVTLENVNPTHVKTKTLFEDEKSDNDNKLLSLVKNVSDNAVNVLSVNEEVLKQPTKQNNIFDDFKRNNEQNSKNTQPIPSKRHSLFSQDEDLFSNGSTVLPKSQELSKSDDSKKRPNLFDDFEEPVSIFTDIPSKNLFDNTKTSEPVKENKKNVINEANTNKNIPIPTKNIDVSKSTKIVESIPEFDSSVNKNDVSGKLSSLSLFDTPPDLEDDIETESEHNLFNDENHLLIEEENEFVSTPRSSIFDLEPPSLSFDDNKNKTEILSETSPVREIDNIDTILSKDKHLPSRSSISIIERLNSIEISSPEIMEDNKRSFEDNAIFSEDTEATDKDNTKSDVEDHLFKNSPMKIESFDTSPKKIGIPGKLKHNLTINVAALLPGATRKPEVAVIEKAAQQPEVESPTRDELDNVGENAGILQCITKDRAKIPIKRRPSTRRARQQNASKSSPEEADSTQNDNENNNEKTLDHPEKIITPPKTDTTDVINQNISKEAKIVVQETKKSTGTVKKSTKSTTKTLFASSDSDSDDIFKITPTLDNYDDIFRTKPSNPPPVNKPPNKSDLFNGKPQSLLEKQPVIKGDVFESPDYKKSKIFFDDDDENVDDFFSSKKLPPKSNIMKKSLFDDEEEGDDLFQTTLFKNDMKPAKITSQPKKSSKTTPLFPVSGDSGTINDPLDLFK